MLLDAFPIISPGYGRLFCSSSHENRHGKPKQKIIFVDVWNLSTGEKLRQKLKHKEKKRPHTNRRVRWFGLVLYDHGRWHYEDVFGLDGWWWSKAQ